MQTPSQKDLDAIELYNVPDLELRKIIWANRNIHTNADPAWNAMAILAHAVLGLRKAPGTNRPKNPAI
jgi:hypothetical protein